MWLNLEAGVGNDLNRRFDARLSVPMYRSGPSRGLRPLVVQAANTFFPEAAVEDLPILARQELADGLTGPLRTEIAATAPGDSRLHELRNRLVVQFGMSADVVGALTVTDNVYLGRLIRDLVPPVVTAGCVCWHEAYRQRGPSLDMAATMAELAQSWTDHPRQRNDVDLQIRDVARRSVRDHTFDIIFAPV